MRAQVLEPLAFGVGHIRGIFENPHAMRFECFTCILKSHFDPNFVKVIVRANVFDVNRYIAHSFRFVFLIELDEKVLAGSREDGLKPSGERFDFPRCITRQRKGDAEF